MSAGPRGSFALRAGAIALLGVAGASAAGVEVAPYLMGIAVPAIVVGCVSVILGVEDLARACFKVAVVLVVVALATPALGSLLLEVLSDPWVQGGLCAIVGLVFFLGALWLAARAMTVKLPERPRVHKAAVRERVALVAPVAILPRPQPQSAEDELRSLR